MPFKKALDIEEILAATESYERVITADTPLADALNSRVKQPLLGRRAVTPRGVVYEESAGDEVKDRRELFLRAVREYNLGYKEAFYWLENALHCWQETGRLEKLLDYERFNSEPARKIVELLKNTANTYRLQAEYTPGKNKKTAVVAPYQFKGLDRRVLPEKFDVIDPFREEKYELPEFKIFSSATAIVQTLLNNITPENAYDVAVVLEEESRYQPLVEAAFLARDIPYIHKTHLSESENFRTWFKLLRFGLAGQRLRLRDLQPLLRKFNCSADVVDNQKYFSSLGDEKLEEIRRLLYRVKNLTFQEILAEFEDRLDVTLPELRVILKQLNFYNRPVTADRLNVVQFYLESFDVNIETDQKKQGVLLASPRSSSYVDRPIVFYVGLDADWTRQVADKPWIDSERARHRNLHDFQILLQNGSQRYYLVQNRQMNEEITPCFYFNILLDENFESFTDLPHRRYRGRREADKNSFTAPEPLAPAPLKTISQSALSRLVRCPREYFFDRLVPTVENRYLKRGQLYHQFAEFYLCHPEVAKEKGTGYFVDLIVDELASFVDELEHYRLITESRVALGNIVQYLDSIDLKEGFVDPDGTPGKYENDNFFGDRLDLPVSSPMSEVWFENEQIGVKGKIDLIQGPGHLLDFKSGSRVSSAAVVKRANIQLLEEDANFQVIMYLSHFRSKNPGRKLKFTFFHFLDNIADVIRGEGEIADTTTTITYYPRRFSEQVFLEETFEWLISGVSETNDRRKMLEGIGYPAYRKFFKKNEIPPVFDKDQILADPVCERFINYARKQFKDVTYVCNGCRSTLKELIYFRCNNFFSEDLDLFEEFVRDRLAELNEYRGSSFPVEGWLEDFDLENTDYRDLIRDER